jgi:LPS-assembly lipoprotein
MSRVWRRVSGGAGIILLLGLSGCGLKPLYGTPDEGTNVDTELASVRIAEERGRLGQLVRNELISTMRSGDAGSYSLKLDVSESTNTVVTYPDPRTSRKSAVVEVGYRLFGDDTRKPLTEGKVKSSVSYDLTRDQQPIADRQARDDAEQRAAIEAAGEIRTRLAVYFSRRP